LRGRSLNSAAGSLLPAEGDAFFVAERVNGPASLAQSFGVLVVTGGEGLLVFDGGGSVAVRRGSTVLIPYAAGACVVRGDVVGVRCLSAGLSVYRFNRGLIRRAPSEGTASR
jgi:mannose-6-phosphate isomerase